MPAQDVDPAALRNIELALQLRPEAFADLSGKPVFELSVRKGSLDFQQAFVADEPIRAATHPLHVVGDEARSLNADILTSYQSAASASTIKPCSIAGEFA